MGDPPRKTQDFDTPRWADVLIFLLVLQPVCFLVLDTLIELFMRGAISSREFGELVLYFPAWCALHLPVAILMYVWLRLRSRRSVCTLLSSLIGWCFPLFFEAIANGSTLQWYENVVISGLLIPYLPPAVLYMLYLRYRRYRAESSPA